MILMMSLILMTRRVLMNFDALEILDDIQAILDDLDTFDLETRLRTYVEGKRLEFAEPQGDCCG